MRVILRVIPWSVVGLFVSLFFFFFFLNKWTFSTSILHLFHFMAITSINFRLFYFKNLLFFIICLPLISLVLSHQPILFSLFSVFSPSLISFPQPIKEYMWFFPSLTLFIVFSVLSLHHHSRPSFLSIGTTLKPPLIFTFFFFFPQSDLAKTPTFLSCNLFGNKTESLLFWVESSLDLTHDPNMGFLG